VLKARDCPSAGLIAAIFIVIVVGKGSLFLEDPGDENTNDKESDVMNCHQDDLPKRQPVYVNLHGVMSRDDGNIADIYSSYPLSLLLTSWQRARRFKRTLTAR
jgi:hypothetical protein